MPEYVRIDTEAGEPVLVAAADGQGRVPARRGTLDDAAETLEKRLGHLRRVLWSAATTLADMPRRPDRLTIEVGATFVAGAGLVIAQTSAEAGIRVIAEWGPAAAGELASPADGPAGRAA